MNFQHLFIGYYILEKKENFKNIKQNKCLGGQNNEKVRSDLQRRRSR